MERILTPEVWKLGFHSRLSCWFTYLRASHWPSGHHFPHVEIRELGSSSVGPFNLLTFCQQNMQFYITCFKIESVEAKINKWLGSCPVFFPLRWFAQATDKNSSWDHSCSERRECDSEMHCGEQQWFARVCSVAQGQWRLVWCWYWEFCSLSATGWRSSGIY